MKRTGLKRIVATLLCMALCLTGMASALADATPSEAKPKQFTAKVFAGENAIEVTIEGASDLPVKASVLNDLGDPVVDSLTRKGNGKITFEKVPEGTFTVVVNYATAVEGIKPVKVEDVIVVSPVAAEPTSEPSAEPTAEPTSEPSAEPTSGPDAEPTADPDAEPTAGPTDDPTANPTPGPTDEPGTTEPGADPTAEPTAEPGTDPEASPSVEPSAEPTTEPSVEPTGAPQLQAITMTATGGTDSVTVTVTAASPEAIVITLMQDEAVKGTKTIAGGVGTVTFTDVPAGTYTVTAAYESGLGGAVAQGSIIVTGKTAPIVITQVTGGENQLVVTGTAQPDSDVTFITEPASTTTVGHTDASGKFTVTITAAAGTYTAVHAQYGSDLTSRVTSSGTFTVTAPATKPVLTVDPVSYSDYIVVAKTDPGVVVNLATNDFAQTVTADSRGILRFTLPHYYAKGTVLTFTVYYGADNAQSFQQTVTVGAPKSYPLLKRGSKDLWVIELTNKLVALGYLKDPSLTFNDTVVAAVRYFQSMNGLSVDGIVGPLTWKALNSVSAIRAGESGVYPVLVRGDRGLSLIYTLQQRLKDLGYYTIRVDGIFGSGTERAVRDFQRNNGLTVTGKADNATQQLLYSSAAKPAWYYGGNYGTLSRSNRYQSAVVPLQRRLKDLGYYTGSIDGYFGSLTQRAVRNFQSRNGISVTGVADPYTQDVLYSASAVAASGSSSSSGSSSTGYRLLYWGCKGDAVKRLQQALLDAGYKQVRVADGIFGQWTYDGVRAYQKDHGLAVDGIAGKNTQNSLYGTNY